MLAGHFLSHNLEMEFGLGDLLSNFMPVLFDDSLIKGFSHYKAEACHEQVHGEGTCGFFAHRDDQCRQTTLGEYIQSYYME